MLSNNAKQTIEINKMKLQITALKRIEARYAINFMGVKVVVAFDRDSGSRIGHAAIAINDQSGSGGSRANWYAFVREGAVYELEVDNEFYAKNKNRIKNWAMVEIEEFTMTKARNSALTHMEANIE
jgi:hypothetical protein